MAITSVPFNASSLGDNTIISAVSGKYLDIFSVLVRCSALTSLTLKGGSTALTGQMLYLSGDGFMLPPLTSTPWFRVAMNTALIINLAGLTGSCAGVVMYEESA